MGLARDAAPDEIKRRKLSRINTIPMSARKRPTRFKRAGRSHHEMLKDPETDLPPRPAGQHWKRPGLSSTARLERRRQPSRPRAPRKGFSEGNGDYSDFRVAAPPGVCHRRQQVLQAPAASAPRYSAALAKTAMPRSSLTWKTPHSGAGHQPARARMDDQGHVVP
jgi:hypothetical protein